MMYTITRGPSKLVTQRRTGPTQQLDNKINDFKHKQTPWNIPDLPATKIVFNRLNGKKYHHAAPALPADNQQEESFTPAHEENIKFVYEGKKPGRKWCSRSRSSVRDQRRLRDQSTIKNLLQAHT
ncbi:MAPK regulated corepressor interacting protein 2-like isoform X2 [Mastacembelus armatus]|uniref:MAPK regulated corepressor interacting protein 2-like isoform X2 n=1 Tax=Mastacembelus armatus TaxID=205130 RepID=UPI000E463102|nr:MAPK regulated corepressor interacting protein 2-like isoform X2 [Mastacembelus armatus]